MQVGTLGRREMLRLLGAAGLVACSKSSSSSAQPPGVDAAAPGFFTDAESKALAAFADVILPPDADPGGSALGAVTYIENLLTSLDGASPQVFAGGPFSGRAPESDGNGGASTTFPPDDFSTFLPLDRVTLAGWRLYLYGSAAVGGGPNDAITGVVIGLRDQVKSGLDAAIASVTSPIEQMSAADAATTFANQPKAFQSLLIELVSEAAFAAPEYGGNAGLAGWKIASFEGDQQPLGFSIWDASTNTMKERAEYPVSTASPGPDPAPLDANGEAIISGIVAFTGGMMFP